MSDTLPALRLAIRAIEWETQQKPGDQTYKSCKIIHLLDIIIFLLPGY